MRAIRTISLFSGCGGSDLALNQLGFRVVWANDISEVACKTYEDNLGPVVKCGSITDFHRFPTADFLVGCYPCQGFTQGGRRNSEDSINFLYQEFDRVLRIVQPKAFVVENVNGMIYGENRLLLDNQLCRYRLAGYRVVWKVLDAQNHGVAQRRRRVFIVGIRSGLDFTYTFPLQQEPQERRLTQRDVLAGMPEWPEGDFNDEPFHWYYLSRRRRCDWDEPSPCIVGHWRHVPLHPMSPPLKRIHTNSWVFARKGRARRLAYPECAALQGFPRRFVWKRGSVRERFQMIGNAVPPPLFRAVVSKLNDLW
ncbi:MAG: DNA (cytosine-5-)-methyltransferase [Acidobacteria bacterium]|nr:DNA (cytosine-5-)-methyltransferase [Acidobacteriota bacterium]